MDVVGGVALVDLAIVGDDAVHLTEIVVGLFGHLARVAFAVFVPHQGECAWYSFLVDVVAFCADNVLVGALQIELRQVRIEGAMGFEVNDLHIVELYEFNIGL